MVFLYAPISSRLSCHSSLHFEPYFQDPKLIFFWNHTSTLLSPHSFFFILLQRLLYRNHVQVLTAGIWCLLFYRNNLFPWNILTLTDKLCVYLFPSSYLNLSLFFLSLLLSLCYRASCSAEMLCLKSVSMKHVFIAYYDTCSIKNLKVWRQ